MAKIRSISEIQSDIAKGTDYVLNSEYDIIWYGSGMADTLNPYNHYIENINIPGKSIAVSESRTANSLVSKMAGEITFEDLEITWRLNKNFEVIAKLESWMSKVKKVDPDDFTVTTGFWDDYCKKNSCEIMVTEASSAGGDVGNFSTKVVCEIRGLYPTSIQSIQFSSEGGDYIKVTATFACYKVITGESLSSDIGS